jgi:hypothetical protein
MRARWSAAARRATSATNPLGGAMVIALFICVAALALTGWLYTTDRFFGDEVVEIVHETLAWTLVALAALHVGGVVLREPSSNARTSSRRCSMVESARRATTTSRDRTHRLTRVNDKSALHLERMRGSPMKTPSLCYTHAVVFAPHGAMEK